MTNVIEMKEKYEGKYRGKIEKATELFLEGAKISMVDENNIMTALTLGLIQGLKYKGNFKRGAKTAFTGMAVIGFGNGLVCVIKNWDKVKQS